VLPVAAPFELALAPALAPKRRHSSQTPGKKISLNTSYGPMKNEEAILTFGIFTWQTWGLSDGMQPNAFSLRVTFEHAASEICSPC
jgi:hypothetical protein